MKNENSIDKKKEYKEKILLGMLPYWTPLIPPQGACVLKSYLEDYGYKVRVMDGNTEDVFKDIYYKYYEVLSQCIPLNKRGNFYNIGHDVLQNHMMAATRYTDENRYVELVKELIYKSFYVEIGDEYAKQLNDLLREFYAGLNKYILELLETEKPEVVGLTVYKGNVAPSMYALNLVKEYNPNIKTVMGGGVFSDSHAVNTPNFEVLLKETEGYVDKIMVGQGEKLFLGYLEGTLPKDQRVYTLKDINMEILDFKLTKIPDMSDINILHYPYLAATGSSSCPYECSFCNSSKFWGKYRKKDTKQIVDEMTTLYNQYGLQTFIMTDSLLNPIITDLANEFINADICLYYDGYFRVDDKACNIDNTLLWRRGGLYRTRLGVESGSQHVLDLMDKRITVDEIKGTVSSLAYAGIKTTTYWVIGHPGETEEDFQKTLDLVEELKDDIWQAECNPFLYHYAGQMHSDQWAKNRMYLYSEDVRDMLVFDSWTLNMEPLRSETYNRMHRFVEHCNKLGIPNPYTVSELYAADERWKRLHKNAVPSIIEFKNWGKYIDECKNVKKIIRAENKLSVSGDFNF